MAAQGDLLGHFQRLAVDDVDGIVSFIADVQPAPVGSGLGPVGPLDTKDLSHDLIGGGIDDVDRIAGAVRLNDPNVARGGQRHRESKHRESRQIMPTQL